MRPLSLDFQRSARRPNLAGAALLALGLAAVVAAGIQYRELADGIASQEAQIAGLERTAQRKPTGTRQTALETQQLGVEIRYANQVVQELSLPWDRLFQAVETAGSEDVALLTVEPDARKRLLKITGEARNLAAVLAYIRLLEQQPVLTDIYLQNHQIQQQDADKPIRFALTASWRAAP